MDHFSEKIVRGDPAQDASMVVREHVSLLIDCSEAMQRVKYAGRDKGCQGLTLFQVALKKVHEIVLYRLVFGVEEDLAIIFFNARDATERSNSNECDGVVVWHPAAPPSLDLLDRLRFFDPTSLATMPCNECTSNVIQNVFVASVMEFSQRKTFSDARAVISVWTQVNSSTAVHPNDKQSLQNIVSLVNKRDLDLFVVDVEDLPDLPSTMRNIHLEILHSIQKARPTRNDTFHSVVKNPRWSHSITGIIPVSDSHGLGRFKGSMKHNSFSIPWHIKTLGCVQMRCSSIVSPAWPKCVGSSTWLDPTDSSLLVSKLFEDVGDAPSLQEMGADPEQEPYYPKQTSKKGSPVAQISVTKDDLSALRFPIPVKCLFLVGFKDFSWLKETWQMKDMQFLRPDDQATPEMRDICAALHQTMVEQNIIAVCGYVKSDQSEPRLAAVVPFSSQAYNQPIGFYLHELPYGDDIRHPERTSDSFGEPTTAMTSNAIGLAENIVRLHRTAPEFRPGVAQNPHIRRHAAVLEAMASDTLGDWIVEEGQPLLARNDPVTRDPDLEAAHLRFKKHYSL